MHQTRKTHNAHNETQRRFKKANEVCYWRYAPERKKHGDKSFFVEFRGSKKAFKKDCNKYFRRHKDTKDVKNIIRKVLGSVLNRWDYIE